MKFSNTDSLSCLLLRCMFEIVGLQVPWSESGNGGGSGEFLSSINGETFDYTAIDICARRRNEVFGLENSSVATIDTYAKNDLIHEFPFVECVFTYQSSFHLLPSVFNASNSQQIFRR